MIGILISIFGIVFMLLLIARKLVDIETYLELIAINVHDLAESNDAKERF